MRSILKKKTLGIMLAAVFALGISQRAEAGLIILEGSDAQTLHFLNPYSTDFLNAMATYSSAPTLPILVWGVGAIAGTPTNGVVYAPGALPLDLLTAYSAIYAASPSGCCDEKPITAAEAALLVAFGLSGGPVGKTIAIEDYQGNDPDYALLLGFNPTTSGGGADVVGFNTEGGGAICFDGNSITPTGTTFGLGPTGPIPPIGCFGHQAYLLSYFASFGFGPSLVDTSTYGPGYSVVLSNGGGGLVPVPEPATLLLFGAGGAALIARRRSRKA